MIPAHHEIPDQPPQYFSECAKCRRPKTTSAHRLCRTCEQIFSLTISHKLAGAIACQIGCPIPWGVRV